MNKKNILFVSENIIKNSHAENISVGIKKFSKQYAEIDYTLEYKRRGYLGLQSVIKDTAFNIKADIIVFLLGISRLISPKFIKQISDSGTKTILCLPDSEHCFEWHDRYYAQCVNLNWILMPAMKTTFRMYDLNCISGFGLSQNIYQNESKPKDIDVSFIGGIYRSNRHSYLRFLEENDIKVEIFGHGSSNGKVNHEKMKDVISRSKISLNFSGVESSKFNSHNTILQCKGRLMEITFLGSLCLSEYAEGTNSLFEDEKEIVYFHTENDLLNKIRFYLKHDKVRQAISNNGQFKAKKYYNIEKIFKKVLLRLDNPSSKMKPVLYFDQIFLKEFNSIRLYWIGFFILRFQLKKAFNEFYGFILFHKTWYKLNYFELIKGIYAGVKNHEF